MTYLSLRLTIYKDDILKLYKLQHGAEKRNRATGYKSNFRPGVYYSTKLDRIDNDSMIGILNDSYVSETAKCFADPVQKRSSNHSLPINLSQKGSGFTRLR